MASNKPRIDIEITADSSDARKDVEKTGKSFDKLKENAGKANAAAAGVVGGILALGAATLSAAGDMERASTTVDRVFGDASDAVKDFADKSAENVGISTEAYLSMAGSIGNSLRGMGLSVQDAASSTDELLTIAGDMALALGTDVPTAADALSAALRGEFDALSEFGVSVSGASVEAGLLAQGIDGPDGMTEAAYNAAYQQELLNQVLGGAGEIFGGYRDETDTTAESTQRMWAEFDNAKAKLGEGLLPIMQTGIEKLTDFAGWVAENKDAIQLWVPIIAGAALAVWALNFAMGANPIVLWTTAILVAVGVIVYFRDAIYNWAIGALTALNDALSSGDWWGTQFQEALGALGLSAADFGETIDNVSGFMSELWDWFNKNWSFTLPVIGIPSIPSIPGFNSAPAGMMSAGLTTVPDVAGRSFGALAAGSPFTAAGAAGTGNVYITVQGAVDPDSTARQIERLLSARARRSGPVAPTAGWVAL